MKKRIVVAAMTCAMVLSLAACGGSASNAPATEAAKAETEAATEAATEAVESVEASVATEEAAADDGGFAEFPIWEDEEVGGFLNVSGVYFQPVPMSGGNENYEDFNLHFEADVSTLDNNLGYGPGAWVPYMTVDYEITGSDGTVAASGSFMPMNADDGPHYGANIKLENADTYSVKLTFHSPEENGYVIHLDDVTGPGGSFDDVWTDGPLVLELPDVWDYTPQEW